MTNEQETTRASLTNMTAPCEWNKENTKRLAKVEGEKPMKSQPSQRTIGN